MSCDIDESGLIDVDVPRDKRTPTTCAFNAVQVAINWQIDLFETCTEKSHEEATSDFFDLFKSAWEDDSTSGDKVIDEMFSASKEAEEKSENIPALIHVAWAVISYTVQAWKAHIIDKNIELAWTYAVDANYWAGILNGTNSYMLSNDILSSNARKAADERHKSNRIVSEKIKHWYIEEGYKFKSKDKAAESAQDKFNRSFRTIRKHITGL